MPVAIYKRCARLQIARLLVKYCNGNCTLPYIPFGGNFRLGNGRISTAK